MNRILNFLPCVVLLGLAPLVGCRGLPPDFNSEALTVQRGGDLSLVPEKPRPGERIEVSYRPADHLAREPQLYLRARLRTPEHEEYNNQMGSSTLAVLKRRQDGSYSGTFYLPEDVVYAALALENEDATHTDTREGRFWEIVISDAAGRPLFEALEQRFNDHMGRDLRVVLESVQELARYYPDHPQSWAMLSIAERWLLDDEAIQAKRDENQAQLLRLERLLTDGRELTPDEVGYMFWYGLVVGNEEVAQRWRSRLITQHPGHFFAVQARAGEFGIEHANDPATLLLELERAWDQATEREARALLISPGLTAARRAQDPDAFTHWADRRVDLYAQSGPQVASMLASYDGTREEGIRRLEREILSVEVAPDQHRPLGATRIEHHEQAASTAASMRATLGRVLLESGRVEEGVLALEEATRQNWESSWFQSLAKGYLTAGDTMAAIQAWAAVAADPGARDANIEQLDIIRGVDDDDWAKIMVRATDEMRSRTLHTARDDRVEPVYVTDPSGNRTRLDQRLGREATVVVFWSPYCNGSDEAMPAITALAEELEKIGVPLLALTRDIPIDSEEYLLKRGWELDVLFDTEGEAARALNSWGTPQYFVLDGNGHLRFAFSSLDVLPRQLMALMTPRQ